MTRNDTTRKLQNRPRVLRWWVILYRDNYKEEVQAFTAQEAKSYASHEGEIMCVKEA